MSQLAVNERSRGDNLLRFCQTRFGDGLGMEYLDLLIDAVGRGRQTPSSSLFKVEALLMLISTRQHDDDDD
jgi:hypothetical protein